MAPCAARAVSVTWSGAQGTLFETGSNWAGNAIPTNNLTADTAVFANAVTANLPSLSASRSISGLSFTTTTGGWTLGSGSSAFILTTGSNGISSTNTSGTNTLSANLALGAGVQTWKVGTGGTLVVTGNVALSGSAALTFTDSSNKGIVILNPSVGNAVNLSGSANNTNLVTFGNPALLVFGGDGGTYGARTQSVNVMTNSGTGSAATSMSLQSSGTVQVNSGVWNVGDLNSGARGTVNLNGGILSFTGVRNTGNSSTPLAINIDGGTLKITGTGAGYITTPTANNGRLGLGASLGTSGTATMNLRTGFVDLARAAGANTLGSGSATNTALTLLNQSGGVFQVGVTAGAAAANKDLQIGAAALTTGTSALTLTGGTLVIAGSLSATTTGTAGGRNNFNFMGGTLTSGTITATNFGSSATATGTSNQFATSASIGTLINCGGTLSPGGGIISTGTNSFGDVTVTATPTTGRTVITGNYLGNGGTAELIFNLSGTTAATAFQETSSGAGKFSNITVSGSTALNDKLSFKLINGYTPGGSDSFVIISSAGTLSGTFNNLYNNRVFSADGTAAFLVTQSGSSVTLSGYQVVTAPTISGTVAPSTVQLGGTVALSVTASSLAPFSYQWYKNGVAIDGATSSTLNIVGAQASDAGTYHVVVTNAVGSSTSTDTTLAVTSPISTQGTVIAAGTTQQFSATPLASSYAWLLDGAAVGTGATFTYAPDVNAVGTHWLQVQENFADGSSDTRQWAVRVSMVIPTGAAKYYVSPTGSDSNNGSLGSPFLTLEKARDTLRSVSHASGATVYLRSGTHWRTSTFTLSGSDSGTAAAPVTYTNYPGETAVISAGKPILASQFTPLASSEVSRVTPGVDTSRIWEADLPTLGISHKGPFPNTFGEWQFYNALASSSSGGIIELFYKGKRMYLSRYPNHNLTDDTLTTSLTMNGVAAGADVAGTGYLNAAGNYTDSNGNIVAVGAAFQYNTTDAAHVARWQTAMTKGGVWVMGYWRVPWQINAGKVGILDTGAKQVIGLASGVNISNGIGYKYSRPVGSKAEPWWVVNLLEELDQPGEWCIDFSRSKLYFMMDVPGAPPDNSVVLSDLGSAMVQISGSYVNFQGITFENGLSQGVQVLGGSRNLVTDCTFRNMGGYAVDLNNLTGGTFNGVLSCDMQNLASGGVLVRGGNNTSSPRVPTNNFIVNNKIQNFAQVVRVYAASVDVGFQYGRPAVGVRVAHNTASGSPHVGMLWKDYDHVFEYNDVSDYCQYSDDMGGIYTFNSNYDSNTTIRYNYLHDSDHGEGVYFDSDHINATVYGNVANLKTLSSEARGYGFYDQTPSGALAAAGVPWTDNSYGNMAVNCHYGLQFYSATGATIENNLAYKNTSSSYKWNLITVGASSTTTSTSSAAVLGSGPNMSYGSDPGFINFAADDLRLRPDSTAYNDMPGFMQIPFEMAGVYNDEYRSDAKVYMPFITTGTALGVGANTATFNGTLVYPQFDANATVLMYWGTTDGGTDPSSWQNVANLGTPGSGAVSKTLASLTPGTQYFFRFFASNSAGSMWSEQSNSTTTYLQSSVATGGTASASSATLPATNAFDGDAATKWQTGNGVVIGAIQYNFANSSAFVVTQYLVTSAADTSARDPKDWQFLGSNDGVNWTTLDTQTGQIFSGRGQTKTYGFANTRPYKYYQLNITANNGDATGLQLAEVQLFAPVVIPDTTGPVIITPGDISLSATSGSGANVYFSVQAIDAVSGNVTATASPVSGSFFPIGTTPVNVSSTDPVGNTSNASFNVTVTAALPPPWIEQQVGTIANGINGYAIYSGSNGAFNVTGGGGDIWSGTTEAFTFIYQPWTDDGILTARIASFSSSDGAAKAGLMFRESLTAGARNSITYLTRTGTAYFQQKISVNGNVSNSSSGSKAAPYWVRLVRSGNSFSGFTSADGNTWTQLGSTGTNVFSGTTAYAGIAVGPRTAGTTASVVVDNVTFLALPTAPTILSGSSSSAQATLTWSSIPGAATYNVKRSTTSGGPYSNVAAGQSGSTYTNTGLTNNTTYYYVVSAVNAVGEGPNSAEFSVTPHFAWSAYQAQYFTSAELADPLISGPLATPANDGMSNLMKYALGFAPKSPAVPNFTLTKSGATMVFTYQRPADRSDITYIPEISPTLANGSWTTTGVTHTRIATGNTETWQATCTPGSNKIFFRLRITQP